MADPTIRDLSNRLAEIAHLDMAALQDAWAGMFGHPPPKTLSRRLLESAVAYDVQAKISGGLKPAIRRKLLRVARTTSASENETPHHKRQGALLPGSRLVREWHGRSHMVEVADRGFLYAGQRYRSLSEVARVITGAQWSGPRFFCL